MSVKLKSIFLLVVFSIGLYSTTLSASAAGINKLEHFWWGTRAHIDTKTTPEIIDALDHEYRNGSNGGGTFASVLIAALLGVTGGLIGGALMWRVNSGIDYSIREMRNLNRQGKGVVLEFDKFKIAFKVYSQ